MSLSVETVKTWLTEIDRPRQWLADELGIHVGSLNNQISQGRFSSFVEKHIERIMRDYQRDQEDREREKLETEPKMRLTYAQWDKLEHARKLAGYEDRDEFFLAALNRLADEILEAQQHKGKAK